MARCCARALAWNMTATALPPCATGVDGRAEMPGYLLLAYAIFCAGPLGLAVSIAIRRRRVRRQIEAWTEKAQDETWPAPR